MTKPTTLNTAHAFRADLRPGRGEATGAAKPAPRNNDDTAPVPGAFTRQELRDLVLHWMG